jgi:hypothetical protein
MFLELPLNEDRLSTFGLIMGPLGPTFGRQLSPSDSLALVDGDSLLLTGSFLSFSFIYSSCSLDISYFSHGEK